MHGQVIKIAQEKQNTPFGGPTVEMIMASYNQTHGDVRESDNQPKYQAKVTETNPLNGYQISYDYGDSWHYNIEDSASYLSTSDTLYINDADASKAYGYWVSSPSAKGIGDVMNVSYDGSVYTGYVTSFLGFRPLVSLQSNVKMQVQKDGTVNIN